MASLTQASIIARRSIRYGIYALILIIIGRFVFNGLVGFYRQLFPPPPPKPTVVFGKLPKLPFPQKNINTTVNYTLDLAEGSLPKLPEQEMVYFMPPFQSNIQVLDSAKSKAAALGFNPEGKTIVENVPNVYLFEKNDAPSALTMNVITGVFSISYNINEDPAVIRGLPPMPDSATGFVTGFLNRGQYLADDLKDSPVTHEFLKIEGGSFVPEVSLSESHLIKVNVFRAHLGKDANIPSVTPDMPEANVWFILSSSQKGIQIIAAEYHYFPIDKTKNGTYPLKTSEPAFEDLKNGKGYIANLGENQSGNITIRKVYLAYYDAGQYTQFYQPVVVFEGDNNFFAYVPAVQDEYYGAETEE